MNTDTEFWLLKPNGRLDPYKLTLLGATALAILYVLYTTFAI